MGLQPARPEGVCCKAKTDPERHSPPSPWIIEESVNGEKVSEEEWSDSLCLWNTVGLVFKVKVAWVSVYFV